MTNHTNHYNSLEKASRTPCETVGSSEKLLLDPITDEEYPSVSIVTPTYNRSNFIKLLFRNWKKINYPREKLEWIIVDDSKTNRLRTLLPKDDRIKYFYLPIPLPIPDKRNYSVKKASNPICIHMDDDDFYFNDSVLAKARIFVDYPEKDCICSEVIGVYDMYSEKSAIVSSQGDDICESTFAYRKKFWKKGKFRAFEQYSEWYGLLHDRWEKVIGLHFMFNNIMTTHSDNVTGRLRSLKNFPSTKTSFRKIWGKETTKIIKNIVK